MFSEALTLIKTFRNMGLDSRTEAPLADFFMDDYYLAVVPYALMNDQNEEIDRGTYVPQHSFSL